MSLYWVVASHVISFVEIRRFRHVLIVLTDKLVAKLIFSSEVII